MRVCLTDESKVEETEGVTTAVHDVINQFFRSKIFQSILNVKSCCLDISYYF